MALDPITAGLDLASNIVSKIWPDKSAQEQAQLSAVLSMITAQTDINKAEAQSTDPLQHWRGGLGWVCVAGYAWNYVLEPISTTAAAFMHYPVTLGRMDMTELSTLTIGMLGLGVTHAWQTVKGK
jgi:hypothetical protein